MSGIALCMPIFILLQIGANILFKYGSLQPERWLPCFIVGNVFGMSSIWFLMKLYQYMNVNVAQALCGGLTFLTVQVLMMKLFDSSVTPVQWLGIVTVCMGMTITALGGKSVY